jgi:hypothetical protein
MPLSVAAVISDLAQVQKLRSERDSDPGLALRVRAIKHHQHARFTRDYRQLLDSQRYGAAARFFLDELYGPGDFAARDGQFARIVPAMARLLPQGAIHVVARLVELHVLSKGLDQQMAGALESNVVDHRSYRAAWQAVGRRADRERQLALLINIGTALDKQTHTPLFGTTLRLMRQPARAAGFARLQTFLEDGLSAFAAMGGAAEFLATITSNERAAIDNLFAVND